MAISNSDNTDVYLKIIESQGRINDRFSHIQRIDNNGGNGVFSLVFTAFDEFNNEWVVLKFYHPSHNTNEDRHNRFRREGDILIKLKGNPNIVECIDGVCTFAIPFNYGPNQIIQNFEYIPLKKADSSIEQIIDAGTASPEEFLLYFREMCKGISRIHNQRICHRDLKPGNFLVFHGNDVRLGDFGTAKFLDGSMPDIREQYHRPVGDVEYIAPETFCQIGIGDMHAFCADVFALGAILFEMFTKEILTHYIYRDRTFVSSLVLLNSHLPARNRTEAYLSIIDYIGSSIRFPEIYSFNNFVPKSIKLHLDTLYKDLARINLTRRLSNFSAIYRRIDICLLTLRNEQKYRKWRERRKQMHEKKLTKLRGNKDAKYEIS